MIKLVKRTSLQVGAAFIAGMMTSGQAHAGNNFSSIGSNITDSISSLPGLLTALSYMFGILLGVLGIMKIKDHVENPGQTALKDGAIRLAAGGALLALPIIYEAMLNTIGNNGANATAATLNKVSFSVN
ncbi:MAG: hypothetical protein HY370_04730 [Proteobacteria bacterium]|nr:hypothetical protein [Pseudomonadota bacterium]